MKKHFLLSLTILATLAPTYAQSNNASAIPWARVLGSYVLGTALCDYTLSDKKICSNCRPLSTRILSALQLPNYILGTYLAHKEYKIDQWEWANFGIGLIGNQLISQYFSRYDDDEILIQSASNGHSNCLKILLARGANINAQDEQGRTALMHAANNGRTHAVRILLEAGANVDMQDDNGDTALIHSIQHNFNYVEIMQLLLKHKANINTHNVLGWTALHCAIHKRYTSDHDIFPDRIALLLDAGARLDTITNNEETLEDLARENNDYYVLDVIKQYKENACQYFKKFYPAIFAHLKLNCKDTENIITEYIIGTKDTTIIHDNDVLRCYADSIRTDYLTLCISNNVTPKQSSSWWKRKVPTFIGIVGAASLLYKYLKYTKKN